MKIKNPVFNKDGSIDCEINHPVYGWIPFTAREDDEESHGRDLYKLCLDKNPKEYVEDVEETSAQVRSIRNHYLINVDKFVSNPLRWEALSEDSQNSVRAYRKSLLDVPQQEGFPLNVEWPEVPEVLK